jgi:hydroxylamine reductase
VRKDGRDVSKCTYIDKLIDNKVANTDISISSEFVSLTQAMQDTLMHTVKSVSLWANAAREAGATEEELHAANVWTIRAVFSTLTNVNFSEDRIAEYIQQGMAIKHDLEKLSTPETKPVGSVAETDLLGKSFEELEEFGHTVGIPKRQEAMGDDDCFSLNEIATYGAKGSYCMM